MFTKLKAFFKKEETKIDLPVGLTEFHTWADRIIAKAGSFADADSMKFALASMLLHAKEDLGAIEDTYFIKRLRKVAANQIAGQVFQDIKTKQEEKRKADAELEAAKTQAEATASTQTVASDGQKS